MRKQHDDIDLRARPRNASTAAPPVSPEVATTMVVRSPRAVSDVVHQPAEELHRQVLEGERRAVEQLEHERRSAPSCTSGATAGWRKVP